MPLVQLAEETRSLTNEKSLKQQLDAIDQEIINDTGNKYYDSAFKVETAMWLKGQAIFKKISGSREGGVEPPSWRQLEKETGRNHSHLKRWHGIYVECPDEQKFLEIAKQKAEAHTLKWLKRIEALNTSEREELPGSEDERVIFLKDWVNCFFNHFNVRETFSDNTTGCEGCVKIGYCKRFAEEIISELLTLREKYLAKKGERNG